MTQINQPHQCQPQEFCWNYWEKNKRAGTLFQKTNRCHRMERTFVKIKPSQKKVELHKGRNRIPEGIIWMELCLNLKFSLDISVIRKKFPSLNKYLLKAYCSNH